MQATLAGHDALVNPAVRPINAAFARGDVVDALRRTTDELADRFCIAGTPEEVAERINRDMLPVGFNRYRSRSPMRNTPDRRPAPRFRACRRPPRR